MGGFRVFLIYVISHLVAGDTKFFRVGRFQCPVKSGPQYDACDDEEECSA
jgi:hypothetical protein